MLVKSVLLGSFSLMVFGWAQILMDLQPLFALLTGIGPLHGFSHTFLGASLLAILAAVTGKPLCQYCLANLPRIGNSRDVNIPWPVAAVSAAIGTFSHVLIDSVMHGDMTPLYPFAAENSLQGTISIAELHGFCVASGLVGLAFYILIQAVRRR